MHNLTQRILYAERYYKALSSSHFESAEEWIQLFDKFVLNEQYGLPEILVLIHPRWYEILGISDPRGGRKFPPAEKSAKCRSNEAYGYECPFHDSLIHVDHEFPFSKGGVTNHSNAMYLCEEHNLSKSTDIHIINWVGIDRKWILKLLDVFTHEIERMKQHKFQKFNKALDRM